MVGMCGCLGGSFFPTFRTAQHTLKSSYVPSSVFHCRKLKNVKNNEISIG